PVVGSIVLCVAAAADAQQSTSGAAVVPLVPIAAARVDGDGDGVPDRLGDTLRIRGRVTYGPYPARGGSETRMVLQDAGGGLRLLEGADARLPLAPEGAEVEALGVLTQYNGQTQLLVNDARVSGGRVPVAPLEVDLPDVLARAEAFEGRLLRLSGRLAFVDGDATLSAGEAAEGGLRVYFRESVFDPDAVARWLADSRHVEVTGILEQFDTRPPFDGGYRLTPRGPADVRVLPTLSDRLAPFAALLALLVVSGLLVAYGRAQRRRAARLARLVEEVRESRAALEREMAERAQAEERRRSAEAALAHAQRLETVGALAGGVAHDFNNLLTVILGNAELILADRDLPAASAERLHELTDAGLRARDLVSHLLAFSRRDDQPEEIGAVDQLFADARRLLRRLVEETVDFTIDCRTDALVPLGSRSFTQIVVNLVVNARDAMPDGGSLRIVAFEQSAGVDSACNPPPGHWSDPARPAGRVVVIEVHDTGRGMDENTRRRATEPFFTTKGPAHGTGMGLATVHGLVQRAGGHLEIESAPGEGTVVRLCLPAVEVSTAGDGDPGSAETDAGGLTLRMRTILLAEDQTLVRSVTAKMLASFADEVLEARDGAEALRLWREHRDRIDVVVSDVLMPRATGVDLGRGIRETGSRVPLIFMSGYGHDRAPQLRGLGGFVEILTKPASLETLRDALERAMASRASTQAD
ncbi:MAG: response regulator, partial [Gemmatimonadetes bacterium]